MKRLFSLPFLLILSFSLSGAPLTALTQTPTVVFKPANLAPAATFTTHASGFAPNSAVSINRDGKTFGVDLYFNEIKKIADGTGSVTFSGSVSELDRGVITFDFSDEAGNTTKGSIAVEGKAPRAFLFAPQVEVTQEDIQVGVTGVGWLGGAKKSVSGFDPEEQKYEPEFTDLCADAPCPERDDGLKLVVVLPRSTPAGVHALVVGELGGNEVRTAVTIPELPENQEANKQRAAIFLVDPPASTVDVISIAVRGDGWGRYDNRKYVQAWFVDPDTEKFYELKVDRNYRDCSFVKGEKLTGRCILETDELFLRLEIPEAVKPNLVPKKYLLLVKTEKNVEAGAVFTILANPTLDTTDGAKIAVAPNHGPVGTSILLFGAGFPKKNIIDVRFDGVYTRLGGALWPNDDGTLENIPLTIPRVMSRNGKDVTITPGIHTIELSAGKVSAKTSFVVEGSPEDKKKEEEKKKKEEEERKRLEKEQEQLKKEQEKIKKAEERLEQERKKLEDALKKKKEQEKKEKDEEDKARLEKERKKLEEELKKKKEQEKKKEEQIENIKDRREEIDDRFCDETLPVTFQPGCVPQKKVDQKSQPKLYVLDSQGKLCRPDLALTFQPGCIGQKLEEQKQLFAGKPCASDVVITFQPGCIIPAKSSEPSTQYYVPDSSGKMCREDIAITFQPGCISRQGTERPQAQLYVPDSQGKACRADIAITFQPGCISQTPTPVLKPFLGKTCNPNLPRIWQEGCIDTQQQAPSSTKQTQATVTITNPQAPICNPLIPKYSQPNCREQ